MVRYGSVQRGARSKGDDSENEHGRYVRSLRAMSKRRFAILVSP
jgi:hypothetical protein